MNHHPLEPLMIIYLGEKDVTRQTLDLYETILKQYISYLKDHQILYATTSDINAYINWKKSKGYSSAWIYQQISCIKGLYRYLSLNQERLALNDIYKEDMAATIQNVHVHHHKQIQVLSIKEAKQLLVCLKNKRKYIWHYRDYAMIYLMITTGLRSVEIRRAKRKDLRHLGDQLILDVQGKGSHSKDDFVKVTKGVYEAIGDYLTKRSDKNPYLFVSHSRKRDLPYLSRTFFLRMFRRVLRECCLDNKKITPHGLRHTAATLNLQRGASLQATKRLMRHSHLSTTMVYAHHINRIEDDSEAKIEEYILKEDALNHDQSWIVLEF